MRTRILSVIAILATCLSCYEPPFEPDMPDQSYFPHTDGSKWKYKLTQSCGWPLEEETCVSTVWGAAARDLYEEGGGFWDSTYMPFSSPTTTMQFMKVVGHEYFAHGYYMKEGKFLDDNLEVGGSWKGGQFWPESTYTVAETNVVKIVQGIPYPGVIVIREVFENDYIPGTGHIREHWYARGVGEIYMKSVFTREDGTSETSVCELIEYYIAPEK